MRDHKRENAYAFSKVTPHENKTNVESFQRRPSQRERTAVSAQRNSTWMCAGSLSWPLLSVQVSRSFILEKRHEWNAYEDAFTYNNVDSTCINSCRREPQ